MSIVTIRLTTLAAALLLIGCAKNDDEESPFGSSGIPPQLRSKNQADASGTAIAPGGNAGPLPIQITPESDIVFTDPDNPDAGIPEIETIMAKPKRGPWEESETIARQTAAREGKPILIWFTDSDRSPLCKAISAELFATNEFGKWADKNIVRLRVDASAKFDDTNLSLGDKITRQQEIKRYVQTLKKRYKVLGHPTILMLNASGEVLWKEAGYKRGQADYTWGLIKQATAATQHQYEGWRKKLESKGYRDWEGKNGRKAFAKLVSYSEGNMILVEPGGERFRTHESKLSKQDRAWIEDQKTIRGIR
jgi:thioredoxin-related protein